MTDPQLDRLYERVLVLRCQTGDEAAFTEIVARYTPRLRVYLRQMLGGGGGSGSGGGGGGGDGHAADDALQDVWLDCFRSIGRLTDAGAFPAWLYRIARDRAYRILRRRGALTMTAMEDANDVVADDEDDEDDAMRDGEAAALVHASLDRLPHEQREVLLLRFIEEMSYEQIATAVGCGVGTVRSRLHYAKRALRREIERNHRR
jgi:RNA polymerase sigma-70 factor (ECF subfamily)